jgi:uncharacterized protein Yka (UPF0111/DUF47 family)
MSEGGKPGILQDLGERALLLPGAVERALRANDRAKYYFTLMQLAARHAQEPGAPAPTLKADREAAGIDATELDGLIAGARREDGLLRIPGADTIHAAIVLCLEEMIAPLELADDAAAFPARLARALRELPAVEGDGVPERYVATLARAGGDSLHGLVLDLHRELNRLQGRLSGDSIGGAPAYGLLAPDRALVEAFVRGVARTAALKFDHPGLQTLATRAGDTLVLQNDLGTTDTHVLVVRIDGLTATIVHADPHLRRAHFLQALVANDGVRWSESRAREASWVAGEVYHMCTGTYAAPDRAALASFLERLGSRLVFLIDWNRARKRLAAFVDGDAAVAILRWAADQEVGHRAFLQAGGERLVNDAIDRGARTSVRYGQRLDEVMGRDAAVDFLRSVLRLASEGLARRRSQDFLRDQIRAELLGRLDTVELTLLRLAAEHATAIVELADAVDAGLRDPASAAVTAQRAGALEAGADAVVRRVRALAAGTARAGFVMLLGEADDAADHLEEVAYLLTLELAPLAPRLARLAALMPAAARTWLACLQAAERLQRGDRAQVAALLEQVERLVAIEHESDAAQREVVTALVRDGVDARLLPIALAAAGGLEQAADAFTHCALALRDQAIGG